jgi:outer membrane protein assembly factor BamB
MSPQPPSQEDRQGARGGGAARQWHYAACATAAVSGAVSLAMLIVLFANRYSVGVLDVRDSIELQRLRERLQEQPGSDEYADDVTRFDYQLRRDYFAGQFLARNAKIILIVSFAVFFISVNGAVFSREKLPHPAGAADREIETTRENMLGRWAVAAGAVVAVAAAAVALWSLQPWRTGLAGLSLRAPAGEESITATRPAAARPAAGAAYDPPSWEQIRANWPYFRGPEGSGVYRSRGVPAEWSEQKNVIWKAKLELPGASSPVVWGGRLFVTVADKNVRKVLCFDAADGKRLWAKTYGDTGANNDLPNVYEEIIYAAGTPVVDGRGVYAVFANGDVVCFDFDGTERWAVNVGDTSENPYGYGGSLAMYRDKVIALHDAGASAIVALDAGDGTEVWRKARRDKTWASPVVARPAAGKPFIMTSGDPFVAAWEPDTGELLWTADVMYGDVAPTPIFAAGKVVATFGGSGTFAIRPGGRGNVTETHVAWRVADNELDKGNFPETNSPLSDGELVYTYTSTSLVCLEAGTGKVVYDEQIDEVASYASPALVGDKIYLFTEKTTVIVRAGRRPKRVAKCLLDEGFDASPAFKDDRMFLRGRASLYCIGKK